MKLKKAQKIKTGFLFVLTVALLISGCETGENDGEPTPDVTNPVQLVTKKVTLTGLRSVATGGNITDDGGQEIVSRGVCWGETTQPEVSGKKTSNGSGSGSFDSEISGLKLNTTYYFRVYATTADSIYYGDEKELTTSITSSIQSDSSSKTSIWLSGIISEELADITQFSGICWDTTTLPTISPNKNLPLEAGEFDIEIKNLEPNTPYHFRSFMIIPDDTLYSVNVQKLTLPQIHTGELLASAAAYAISSNTFDPEENGEGEIMDKGICIATKTNPTIDDKLVSNGQSISDFYSIIRSLNGNTTYYIKAFATNEEGTGYGEEISFTTPEKRKITFNLNMNDTPSGDQLDAYVRITNSMNEAVTYYDEHTEWVKHVTANYVPGVPTADANYEGWMRFGSNRSHMNVRTTLHEISHTVGIGTSNGFYNLMVDNTWTGSIGTAMVRELTSNQNQVIHQYGVHIGPFGLNYDSEGNAPKDFINHCKLLEAMRQDGL